MTEKSAGFILTSNNFHDFHYSVLLLHYRSGHWDFPKGNIETYETEFQAAFWRDRCHSAELLEEDV